MYPGATGLWIVCVAPTVGGIREPDDAPALLRTAAFAETLPVATDLPGEFLAQKAMSDGVQMPPVYPAVGVVLEVKVVGEPLFAHRSNYREIEKTGVAREI